MPGGNVGTGLVVDLASEFSSIGPVDPRRRVVEVGPGAVASRVAVEAAKHGLFLPPLPSSADRCTIGGMAANNAAGARSFRFGSTGEWVEELEVVLADGRVVRLTGEEGTGMILDSPPPPSWSPETPLPRPWPAVRKNSSGYDLPGVRQGDLRRLFVGSEGTLGVITSVVLRLEALPTSAGVGLLGLDSVERLPEAAATALTHGLWACEFFSRSFLDLAGLEADPDFGPLVAGMEAVLLVESGGSPRAVKEGLAAMGAWAAPQGLPWTWSDEPGRAKTLWSLRHAASPVIQARAGQGLVSTQFIEDSVVPVARLPRYLARLEGILEDAGFQAVMFGHAGDGNVHVNPLIDRSRPGWRDRARVVLERTAELVRDLGGTLAGEHGDGRIRAPHLATIWGVDMVRAFEDTKAAMDPSGILNPGVVLPLPGQDPLAGMG
jgi:FAD/FMN-containing dehydrogenase